MKYSNITIFVAELLGTFGLLVAATGSIVYDGKVGGTLGIIFISCIHFVGLTIVVYVFGKYSLAHFNPAITIGFFLAGYIKVKQIPIYFAAQATGAFLGTVFVKYMIGDFANLGTNFPNYTYPISFFYGIEIIATILLMTVILVIMHYEKLKKLSGIAIGGIIALDVYFFGPISGGSMNPIRSLSPALVSGVTNDLWIYLTSPFIGAIIVALLYRKKFSVPKNPL
jgi:aquaporin Z